MSHTPNPYGSYIINNPFGTILGHGGHIPDSSGITVDPPKEVKDLKAELDQLKTTVNTQYEAIQELYRLITELQQNNSGQSGYRVVGYWDET